MHVMVTHDTARHRQAMEVILVVLGGVMTRPTEPLAGHPVMHTADVDEARHVVTEVYVPHELDTAGGRPLDARLNVVASPRLTLGYLIYGADASLTLPPLRHCYHVNLTLSGTTRATRRGGREEVVTAGMRNGVVLLPSEDSTVSWTPEATQYVMKFPRGPLEEHLGGLLGRPVVDTINFDVTMDLRDGPGAQLLSAVRFLQTEIDRPGGLLDAPLARAQLETYVMTSLLLGVPNSYSDALRTSGGQEHPTVVRQTMDYVEAHVDEPLSVSTIARHAGVTARTLQISFSRHLGVSPSEYVRDVRLGRVHADLMTGHPTDMSVTERAMRWGFVNMGRFSDQYRRKYGQLPSATLRSG
ncbi:MAG: helix-turn-helix domain-containing protein [Pseudonocardiaceae bacterium]|nr:helix-turn-helix domain-containing protein [Pseudonocardiaceae bacterium]